MTDAIPILVIDDDAALAEMLTLHLDDLGYNAAQAHTGQEALQQFRKLQPKLVLVDQNLPDTTGIDLVGTFKTMTPQTRVVMITGMQDMSLAIRAIKQGADDYIHKPIDIDRLEQVVQKFMQAGPQRVGVKAAKTVDTRPEIIGTSTDVLEVCKKIALASESTASVLVTGESGTGKELVARAIHAHSGRKGPFVAVNCAALVDTLLESELFGHEKGAFTGAVARKEGKFAAAENGTLFLDEIGEMSPQLQAKLLRVLQEGTFERVGGLETLHHNARIITATHRDLGQMVKAGTFRQDLLYRLRVISIHMQPLRQHVQDLPQLVPHLLARINSKSSHDIAGVTDRALTALMAYSWPGNVRELENILTQAGAMQRSGLIDVESLSLPTENGAPTAKLTLGSLDDMEKQHIQQVLQATAGHLGNACAILKISRPALARKMKKFGLAG